MCGACGAVAMLDGTGWDGMGWCNERSDSCVGRALVPAKRVSQPASLPMRTVRVLLCSSCALLTAAAAAAFASQSLFRLTRSFRFSTGTVVPSVQHLRINSFDSVLRSTRPKQAAAACCHCQCPHTTRQSWLADNNIQLVSFRAKSVSGS